MSTKRLSKSDRTKITIESPLNEIMIGLLLGDGHIQKRSINGNSRFIYGQSSLRLHHLNYFNHVFELFKPYLSKDFNLVAIAAAERYLDHLKLREPTLVIVLLVLLHYHCHVLTISKFCFITQMN